MSCCAGNAAGLTCHCSGLGIAGMPIRKSERAKPRMWVTPLAAIPGGVAGGAGHGGGAAACPGGVGGLGFTAGGSGPCDAECRKCDAEQKVLAKPPPSERTPHMPTTAEEWRAVLAAIGIDLPPPVNVWSIIDPLDVEYDGVTLRRLLEMDENRRTERIPGVILSPGQRAAISAHWSAELRAKIATSKAAERRRVTITHDED